MLKKLFGASWRTAISGIAGGLVLILQQVVNALDSDPNTLFVWGQVVAGAAMLGLGWTARDDKVSSEEAGAK